VTRLIVMFAMLTACTGEDAPEPHEFVECDMAWRQNGYTECEGACQKSSPALLAMGPSCPGRTSNGPVSCSKTFEYMGIAGCCIASSPQMLFAECD
jgi:hypothetical protein